MTWEEVLNKFKLQACDIIGIEKADSIIDLISHLEAVEDVSALGSLLKK